MSANLRPGRLAREVIVNRLPVDAHVGVIHERQQAYRSPSIRNHSGMKLQFEIFRPGTAKIPLQVRTVRDFGHQRLAEAEGPVAVVIFSDYADGVAASVRGVVVSAVVVHRPIHELGVTVTATVVEIKEVRHPKLAGAQFQPPNRQTGGQAKRTALSLDHFRAEGNDLANHRPRQVGAGAEFRVADHVDIHESGQAQRVTQAATGGAFYIREELGRITELVAEKNCGDIRGGVLDLRTKAVLSAVGSLK